MTISSRRAARALRRGAGGILAVLAGGCAATVVERNPPAPGPADLVVTNARVVTLDSIRPDAEAFAVSGGRFRVVGGADQVRRFVGPRTRVVDAAGGTVLPGLIDAHLHLFGEGFRLMRLDLVGTRSKDEVRALLWKYAQDPARSGWLLGRGWDQNDWPGGAYPTAADIDAVVPDRPVALTRIDGHAVWVNGAALRAAGIGRETPDPPGGRIVRDAAGEPTGILIDAAADLVLGRIPPRSREEKMEAARRAARECVAAGLTGVHEAGIGAEEVEVLKELYRRGEMPLRMYVMLSPGPALDRYVEAGPEVGLFKQRLTIRAVKFYADGALGSRGARLLEDYADEPGSRGLELMSRSELESEVRRVSLAGLQPCVHAIGDAANRMVLDVYEAVFAAPARRRGARPRIEHAQIVSPADLGRFAELGVVASMQPTHATSDMPWLAERLGDRPAAAYAWQSLLRSGAHVAFGSDAPVESVRPLLGLYAAVTRQDASGNPPGGFTPAERVGIEQAIRGYTTGAAHAAFEEDLKGSISPGRLADFVVLSDDPRAVPPGRLPDLKVVSTWVGGEPVYEAP